MCVLYKPLSLYNPSKNASNAALPLTRIDIKINIKINTKDIKMTTFLNDCLPSKGFFKSRKTLFESINIYVKPRGYVFTTQQSIRDNSFLKIFYIYDRSRRLPSSFEYNCQRLTTIHITNCPFSIFVKKFNEN